MTHYPPIYGVLLPVHETYYGEIHPDDLSRFLACAGEALRTLGFERYETLNAGTDREKELWGLNGKVCVDKSSPDNLPIHHFHTGAICTINLNWLLLVDYDTEAIVTELQGAIDIAGNCFAPTR
jgi:hypothetical protein